MFKKKPVEKTVLDKTIDDLLDQMSRQSGYSDEYTQMAKNVVVLSSAKNEIECSKKTVNPDTLLLVGGNLLGILMIVGHERAGIVTSKALNFIMKLK